MSININTNTFKSVPILPDGNCQYRSISYCLYKSENLYKKIKTNVIKYIIDNKDIFSNYIYDMTFEEYIENISEENEWGNEVTLLAASLYLEIEINIYDKYTNEKISTYNELSYDSTDKKIYLYYDNLMMHYDAIEIVDINNIMHHMDNININEDKYNLYRAVAYCLCKREDLYKEIIKIVYNHLIDNKKIIDRFLNLKGAEFIANNDHILNYIIDDITYEEFIKGFAKYKIFSDNNVLRLISLKMKINIIIYKKGTKDIIKNYISKNSNKTIQMFYDEITKYFNSI